MSRWDAVYTVGRIGPPCQCGGALSLYCFDADMARGTGYSPWRCDDCGKLERINGTTTADEFTEEFVKSRMVNADE